MSFVAEEHFEVVIVANEGIAKFRKRKRDEKDPDNPVDFADQRKTRRADKVRERHRAKGYHNSPKDLPARVDEAALHDRARVVTRLSAPRFAAVHDHVRLVNDKLFLWDLNRMAALWTRPLLTRKTIVDFK
jgi:hypothetical protein